MSLGKVLADHRKAAGLTQQQLGERVSVSAQAVSKWENDQAEPDLQTLRRLCALYKIQIDDLFREKAETNGLAAASASVAPSADGEEKPSVLVGYCADCGCAVYQGNEVRHPSAGLLCKMCYGKRVNKARANGARVSSARASSAAANGAAANSKAKGLNAPSIYTCKAPDDSRRFGWAFISFLIPLVGLILFLVWRDYRPLRASSCLRGFIVSIVLNAVWVVLIVCLTLCTGNRY